MMDYSIDNLKKLVEKIKTISFFDRIFRWAGIKDLLIEAGADIQKMISFAEFNQINLLKYEALNSGLSKDIELSNGNIIRQSIEIENYKLTSQENIDKLNAAKSLLSVS